MWRAICLASIIALSSSLTCNRWEMSENEYTTCTGDACISYMYDGYVRMMGCAKNVMFSNRTGCFGFVQEDHQDLICSCQEERCNNYNTFVDLVLKAQPLISCFSNSASKCSGISCSLARVGNENLNTCEAGNLQLLSFIQLQANLILIDQTSKEQLDDSRDLSYYSSSEFHANCLDKDCVARAQKLRKGGLKSKKRQVECHSYPLEDRNNLTCKGDFCYYQNLNDAVTRGCYTIDDSLAERKLTVGFYEYFNIYVYLCNKPFCNEDETTAKMNRVPSAEKYQLKLETTTQGVQRTSNGLMCIIFILLLV